MSNLDHNNPPRRDEVSNSYSNQNHTDRQKTALPQTPATGQNLRSSYYYHLIDEVLAIKHPDHNNIKRLQRMMTARSPDGEAARHELTTYLLRAENSFLSFVEPNKPLPSGLTTLLRSDEHFFTALAPMIETPAKEKFVNSAIAHLSLLGRHDSWSEDNFRELEHASLLLYFCDGSKFLLLPSDSNSSSSSQARCLALGEAANSVLSILNSYAGIAKQYPQFVYSTLCFVTLPLPWSQLNCTQELRTLWSTVATLFDYISDKEDCDESFLNFSSGDITVFDEPGTYLPYFESSDFILDDDLEHELSISDVARQQELYASVIKLDRDLICVLVEQPGALSGREWHRHLYNNSIYRPSWIHFARGLAHENTSLFEGMLFDLIPKATTDKVAALHLISLSACDIIDDRGFPKAASQSIASVANVLGSELVHGLLINLWLVAQESDPTLIGQCDIDLDEDLINRAVTEIKKQLDKK